MLARAATSVNIGSKSKRDSISSSSAGVSRYTPLQVRTHSSQALAARWGLSNTVCGLQALRAEVLAAGLKKLNAAQVSKYPSNPTYLSVVTCYLQLCSCIWRYYIAFAKAANPKVKAHCDQVPVLHMYRQMDYHRERQMTCLILMCVSKWRRRVQASLTCEL